MVFYLDTSAAVKLVVAEREARVLAAWIADNDDRIVGSDLLRTELLRAVRRGAPEHMERARGVLDAIDLLALRTELCERAADIDPVTLRTFDALHLACALDLGDELDGVVTYDDRLAAAPAEHGVTVIAPT